MKTFDASLYHLMPLVLGHEAPIKAAEIPKQEFCLCIVSILRQ